jgi:hypothetical protein
MPDALPGLDDFAQVHKPKRTLIVGGNGVPLDDFLSKPIEHWLAVS